MTLLPRTVAPPAPLRPSALLKRACAAAGFLLLASVLAPAQTNVTDATTPPGTAPGAPAGSYGLSGFENVNLYSGNLNFHLPLLKIGGRGSAQTTIYLSIDSVRWTTEKTTSSNDSPEQIPCGSEELECTHPPIIGSAQNTQTDYHTADPNWWQGLEVGYGPGVMHGRRHKFRGAHISGTAGTLLTRLTFTGPDGTEYELRDKLTNGQPRYLTLNQQVSRGTVFVSADGAAATFISDAEIIDRNDSNYDADKLFYPTGYLLLADGTRYRVEGGLVRWLRDRNGNRLAFAYDGFNRVSTITDSLGRVVTVSYASGSVAYDQINFAGAAGVPRAIRVWRTSLGNALRPGFALKALGGPSGLFPELNSTDTTTFNPAGVAWKVELPDARYYELKYNHYNELAQVTLPTGGAVQYDYTPGSGVETGYYQIHRRVVERRVYPDGATLKSKQTYGVTYTSNTETQVLAEEKDAAGGLLARSRHRFHGSALAYQSPAMFYAPWDAGREFETQSLDVTTPDPAAAAVLRRSTNTWQPGTPLSQWGTNADAVAGPYVSATVTTLGDTNQVSRQEFKYDRYNNRTDLWEFEYGAGQPGPLVRHTHTDYVTTNAAGGTTYDYACDPVTTCASGVAAASVVHLRGLPEAQQVYSVGGGAERLVAKSETLYDEAAYPALNYGAVTGWETPGAARGLATTSRRWLDTSNAWLESHAQYDQVGNVRYAWDAKGNRSELSYADSFSDSVGRNTYALPTQTASAIPAPSPGPHAGRGLTTALTSSTVYDYSTGLVTSSTDANGKTTYLHYKDDGNIADPLDRLRRVERPDGGVTKYNYGDAVGNLHVRAITYRGANQTLPVESRQYFDGLGRPVRSFLYDGSQWITSDTEYDSQGRAWRASANPYVSSGAGSAVNPSGHWVETTFDALGRATQVRTTPDNARVVTSYSGNTVTVTDQAGKKRRSVTDALGRIAQVVEAPEVSSCQTTGAGCATNYTYDALGNLRKVEQGGQLRYFMYDSLGRLTRARNPEQAVNGSLNTSPDPVSGNTQWSTAYDYDPNGNLWHRTDARNVTSTYAYDNLNRLVRTDYSDATPFTLLTYDFAQNGRGRLYADHAGGTQGATNYVMAYDAAGRPTSRQTDFYLNGTGWVGGYATTRAYDLAGNVTSQTYPSGHVVNNTQFDAAGRLKSVSGNLGDGTARTYAGDISYDEAGRMREERFGTQTPLYHKLHYNARGQLYDVRLSTVAWASDQWDWNRGCLALFYSQKEMGAVTNEARALSGPENNGNVLEGRHWAPAQGGGHGVTGQTYAYDGLNRLTSVTERQNFGAPTGEQHYTYDRFGNRAVNAGATYGTGIPEPQFGVDAATNRIGVPAHQGGVMTYDAAGNLTADTYSANAAQRSYDAEGRMTQEQNSGTSIFYKYTYDAASRRTRRDLGGNVTWQVYGFDGELLAEYAQNGAPAAPKKEYGYRSGELLVVADAPAKANVALSSAGATATASSTHSPNYPASAAVNGDRKGANWNAGGGWNDATMSSFPDWLQVDFSGSKTIDEIDVFTLQDTSASPSEPTEAMIFTQYGATGYDVQYWTGSAWATVPGGSMAGNNKVWRKFTFAPVVTTKIRVLVTGAGPADGAYSRVVEVEAWAAAAGAQGDVRWLVTDHLGTPRMTADLSGSLQGIRRHDYLPFGEKLAVGAGGRSAAQGYAADSVRQKFTGYERDGEISLDYSQARYYAHSQGRFTSPDPLLASGSPASPQTWNRYSYVGNNPLAYTDPSGMIATPPQQPPPSVKVEIKPEEVGLTFLTERVEGDGQARLPVSPEVNAILNRGVAVMASNILSSMVATYNLEQTPATSQQTTASSSTSVSLQAGLGNPSLSASTQSGSTTQVTSATTDPIVTATRNANDVTQIQLSQTLSNMVSPTVVNPAGAVLGQAAAGDAPNLAISLSDCARTRANEVARKYYTDHFPGRSIPKAFQPSMVDIWLGKSRY